MQVVLAPVVVPNGQWGLLPLGLRCSVVMLVAAISEARDAARLLVEGCKMKLRGVVVVACSLNLPLVVRRTVVVAHRIVELDLALALLDREGIAVGSMLVLL